MTIEYTMRVHKGIEKQTAGESEATPSRPPRIARLLALAHRFHALVDSGAVKGYAELARLAHVTQARLSQIMKLLYLAPDLQEYILWLPPSLERGITERDMRPIAAEVRWDRQRLLFRKHEQHLLPSGVEKQG